MKVYNLKGLIYFSQEVRDLIDHFPACFGDDLVVIVLPFEGHIALKKVFFKA